MAVLDLEGTEAELSWEGIPCFGLHYDNTTPGSELGELKTQYGSLFSDNSDSLVAAADDVDAEAAVAHIRDIADNHVT